MGRQMIDGWVVWWTDDGWMGRWRIDELVMNEQTGRQMNEQMDRGQQRD